ncbi:MAG: hypothetical protein AAF543_04935 [Pseudomonadota bacterium]
MMNVLDIAGDEQPVRKSAQRLRWFFQSFEEQVARSSAATNVVYAVDQSLLAEAFADWLKAFNAQKPKAAGDKLAFVGFAAGLMLRTLVIKKPASVTSMPENADLSDPAYFWPEGHLYVAYCLHVRSLVVEKDFHGEQRATDLLGDLRTWWSFKENVEEDPARAIAFLDLFAGEEPDWTVPGLFRTDNARDLLERPAPGELTRPAS